MAGRLTGKVAVITAAGQGIGRAGALAFAREGARVIATDVNQAALADLAAAAPEIAVEPLNVLDAPAIAAFFERHAEIDVLFNVAGFVANGTILDCSEEEWRFSFDLNVTSMYRTIRAVMPGMAARGRGSIINVSSVAGSIKGAPNRFAYGSTKAAVIGLTKAVAADFVARGVRCNAICPGTIDTPSLQQRIASAPDPTAALANFLARQPSGRFGRAEEVAEMAVFLASDESSFTTGAALLVDGGWAN